MKLNVGCGRSKLNGWVNLDGVWNPLADFHMDLESFTPVEVEMLRRYQGPAAEILCSHVLEHIHNLLPVMQMLWEISDPDCTMTIRAPYGSSDDAIEDPTHVRSFVLGSWQTFGQPYYWRADYGYRGDWAVDKIQLLTKVGSETAIAAKEGELGEATQYLHTLRNQVQEQVVTLRAVKPARAPQQEINPVRPDIQLVY